MGNVSTLILGVHQGDLHGVLVYGDRSVKTRKKSFVRRRCTDRPVRNKWKVWSRVSVIRRTISSLT